MAAIMPCKTSTIERATMINTIKFMQRSWLIHKTTINVKILLLKMKMMVAMRKMVMISNDNKEVENSALVKYHKNSNLQKL